MITRLSLFAALLLPFFVSCSHHAALVKKPTRTTSPKKIHGKPAKTPSRLAAADEEGAFHIVGKGETLGHICDVYGLDVKKVAKVNELKRPYRLLEGDTIFLPATALVETKPGSLQARRTAKKKRRKKVAARKRAARNVALAIRGKRHPLVPNLKFPVPGGVLTSPFGHRWGVFHKGLDIAAPIGRSVLACERGRVIFAGRKRALRNYGRVVILEHGPGVYTQYAHLHRILVKKGQTVKRGRKIATVGNTGRSTGPHLHLEVRVRNQMYNPLAYFSPPELRGMRVTKRFATSPMGPVAAGSRIPEILASRR
jgi:murein DD-endopeptidase MepM/ murein hydrolase activator NlpD